MLPLAAQGLSTHPQCTIHIQASQHTMSESVHLSTPVRITLVPQVLLFSSHKLFL
jgi:hypothetical protein